MISQAENRRLSSFICRSFLSYAMPLALLVVLSGCSGGPAPLELPGFDPSGSAAKAMELYDTNGDGFVAGEELENAPGLKAAIKTLDANNDEQISEEEIAERIRAWDEMQIGMMSFNSEFYLDGKPLTDAVITFDPDEFLEGVVQSAVGETGFAGEARPKVPKEKRPTPETPPGMQAGIYKVRVSKIVGGTETIPAKYNTETILGQEVTQDDWAISNKQVIFKLKSK